ncbi:MAG: esterase-like activity of phytase family protein [Vicinamibacterales bacterium]
MKRFTIGLMLAALLAGITSVTTEASFPWSFRRARPVQRVDRDKSFRRIATFGDYRNVSPADAADETVSEITAATADGRTLVYTDAVRGTIGLIDITNPAQPQPLGVFPLDADPDDAIEHSPTSVDVLGNHYALVAVDTTSGDFANPSGYLLVVDISNPAAPFAAAPPIDLHGQPDSLKISADRRFAAIAIENQRNEDLCVGGTFDGTEADEDDCVDGGGALGVLPQLPAGFLSVIRLAGPPSGWTPAAVDLTGLAGYAPGDPEPEFVDINHRNEVVVTLQENNHVVIVDLPTLAVTGHFPAGTVTLDGVDTADDGVIALTDVLTDVPREPDAVTWVPGPRGIDRIGTANEGDLFGGSRGFSIFGQDGSVVYDSGTSFEQLAVRHGHYPDGRSDNKGSEPESIVQARFAGQEYLFVGSERGSFVAVYVLDGLGQPHFKQLLPAPLGPEGLLAIPQRDLARRVRGDRPRGRRRALHGDDLPARGRRAGLSADPVGRRRDRVAHPLVGAVRHGGGAREPDSVLAVWDSAYSTSRIVHIDASDSPAVITEALTIVPGAVGTGDYDPEGIAIAPDLSLWVASEGNASDSRPNRLMKVDPASGLVLAEVGLPAEIVACRAATTGTVPRRTLGSGFEGVTVLPGEGGRYRLAVAQQRGWNYTTPECEDLDDDAGGFNALGEPNWTRIWIYDPFTGAWSHVAWELAALTPNAAWIGLSEITRLPEGDFIVVERDNLTGDFAVLKTLVKVGAGALADGVISAGEKSVYDLVPHLRATNGWITDKVEGVAVNGGGRVLVSTDNDGVDDWNGETWFFKLRQCWTLFQ